MTHLESLKSLRELLITSNEKTDEIEMTTGNFNDQGALITEKVPTLTTNFCEIGTYDDKWYLTFIIESEFLTSELFDKLKNFPELQLYAYKNFKQTIYPNKSAVTFEKIKELARREEFLQLNFNFSRDLTPAKLFEKYLNIKKTFEKLNCAVVDQLKNLP